MTIAHVATTAILLARGCPEQALDTAADWLGRQLPAERPSAILRQVDEAITVASSLEHDDD